MVRFSARIVIAPCHAVVVSPGRTLGPNTYHSERSAKTLTPRGCRSDSARLVPAGLARPPPDPAWRPSPSICSASWIDGSRCRLHAD